jgi:hypothetical protein
MSNHIDLNKYTQFVNAVTSKETNNYDHLHQRLVAVSYTHLTLPTNVP